jgi:hypothetical protein
MGMGQVALILGVVALVLGGSAVGIALTHTGPAGVAGGNGLPGAQGPPGPGAVVKQSFNGGTTTLTSTCGFYAGSNISFAVSSPGTFVITSSVLLLIQHTLGNFTFYTLSLANVSATCNPSLNNFVEGSLSDALPSGNYGPAYSLVQSFQVGAAGTYTFGIIGEQTGGTDVTDFYYASVAGVFYPS